jgi:hypothetical protein
MKNFVAGLAMAALATSPLAAQDAAPPASPDGAVAATSAAIAVEAVATPAPAAPPQLLTLTAGTPITVAVAEEVNSSSHRGGDTFKLTVLNDVKIGDTIAIPRGAPALAEITWRTGKGAFGKSGKLEFYLRHIDLSGTPVPVTGTFRQEGEGNTVATGVGVIAIGLFAGFITGKRAQLPVGRELMAQLSQPVEFTADGKLAASFDSAAAVAAAEAKSPLGPCKAAANALASEKKRKKALEDCYAERME